MIVHRLIYWELNNNFGFEPVDDAEYDSIKTPPSENYKDLNATSHVPALTRKHIEVYLENFDTKISPSSESMYENGYLRYLRFNLQGILIFFKL